MQMAALSLNGLSVGDALGNMLSFQPELVRRRETPVPSWLFTDDTVMAICIARSLREHGTVHQDDLAHRFAQEYALDPRRGYGSGAQEILSGIRQGRDWRELSASVFQGTGSMGNGAAMRVGPLGAWFYDSPGTAAGQAELSSRITHWHPEGIAGATAVAVACSFAANWSLKDVVKQNRSQLLQVVLPFVNASQTRDGLLRALQISDEQTAAEAAEILGCGEKVLSQDTVPFCLWTAQKHLLSYPDAIWESASVFGDIDTNCAIVGSIVSVAAGHGGIPKDWLLSREPLNG
jgi:ADP-ribosylglycohydrolase